MHSTHRNIVFLLALVLAIAGLVQAQDKPAGPPPSTQGEQATTTASGELTEVDAKAATIVVKTATDEMKFRYDDQTKVTGAQKNVAGLSTMKGSDVTVQYKKEGANNIATSIEIHAAEKK